MKSATIGVRLHTIRRQAGLSIASLSKILGLASSYLSLLESGGRTNPSLEVVQKLCCFYGVNRDWLIDGGGPQFSSLSPEVATARLIALLQQVNFPDGEAELRKRKMRAEINIRLSEIKRSSREQWMETRSQIIRLIDDYAALIFNANPPTDTQ